MGEMWGEERVGAPGAEPWPFGVALSFGQGGAGLAGTPVLLEGPQGICSRVLLLQVQGVRGASRAGGEGSV